MNKKIQQAFFMISGGMLMTITTPHHCEAAKPHLVGCKVKVLKKEGHIQEDGKAYVVAVAKDKKTQDCVSKINTKRRTKYEAIAKKEQVPLDEVEKLAAEKLK